MASADGTPDRSCETGLGAAVAAERIEAGATLTVADTRVLADALLTIAGQAMPDTHLAGDSRCRLARAVLARQQPGTRIRSGSVDLHTLDAERLVDTLHLQGEVTGKHTTEAAEQALELLMYLAHATLDAAQAVPDPNTSAQLLLLITRMINSQGQWISLLADRQRHLAQDARATLDATGRQHGGPDTVAELTAINIESAAGKLEEANALLRAAASHAQAFSFAPPMDAAAAGKGAR